MSQPDIIYMVDTPFQPRKPTRKKLENYKKKIHNSLKSHSLWITVENEHSLVNYSGVSFDLINGTYKSYHKNNNNFRYISTFSNQPFSMKSVLVYNISLSISNSAFAINTFKDNVEYYNSALTKAGYSNIIQYITIDDKFEEVIKLKHKLKPQNGPYNIYDNNMHNINVYVTKNRKNINVPHIKTKN